MLAQVQMLSLDWRFGFAGAAAVLMLVQVKELALVQALALDRRFVLRHARGDIMCHAQNEITSCQGRHQVMPGMTSCHARGDIDMLSCQG